MIFISKHLDQLMLSILSQQHFSYTWQATFTRTENCNRNEEMLTVVGSVIPHEVRFL